MKYKVIIITLFIIFVCTLYRKYSNNHHIQLQKEVEIKSNGRFECLETSYNAGTVTKDTILNKTFHLKNIGTQPLKIKEFKTSCDCTSASFNDSIIYPQDTAFFKMQVDTKGKFPGLHQIDGIIKTNGEKTFYRLKIVFCIDNHRLDHKVK